MRGKRKTPGPAFCSLRSATLSLIIPVIVTPYETEGETLGGAGAALWVSSCLPPFALGGRTSGEHEEEKGGAYDGGRHAEYCETRTGLSGPLRLEQSARQGSTPACVSR